MPSKPSVTNKSNNQKLASRERVIRKRWIIAGIIVACILLYDISPFGGNIRFYSKWIECGHKPVATLGSGYLNSGAIHYYTPPDFSFTHPSIEYFCTPLQAEQAGYSASATSYSFPHLKQQ